jgi:putative colanic acid biosynthesis UDP-glucose lipid carrier transferase
MIRRIYTINRLVLPVLDSAILIIAYGVSFLLKRPGTHQIAAFDIYNTFLLFQMICWLLIGSYTRIYRGTESIHIIRHLTQLFRNWFVLVLISFAFINMMKAGHLFSRGFLLYYYGFLLMGFIFLRLSHHTLVRKGAAGMKRRILFIGGGIALRQLFDRILKIPYYTIVGVLSAQDVMAKITIRSKYSANEWEQFLFKENVNEVLLALTGIEREHVIEIVNFCEERGVRVTLVPDYIETVYGRGLMEELEGIPVVALRSEPLDNIMNRFIKRLFDIVFSGIIVALILPVVTLFVGILIKFFSPGPVFFRQERTGLSGKNFKLWKFRTMQVTDRDIADKVAAEFNDPRITRLGQFLRKSSIDELPQFINVLLGDMSVVGPRPHMLAHTDQYKSIVSKYMVRHFVKPGLTGWAQVNGYRGTTEHVFLMEKRVEYDIYYIENWSMLFDIQIIFMTILVLLRGDARAF